MSALERRRTNLPAVGPLLAREPDLAAVRTAFDDEGARLVTLLGLGGIGKTHLAIHFAASEMEACTGGGVWFVDLTHVRDGEGLDAAFVEALRGPGGRGGFVDDIMRSLSRGGRCLVVVDNAEPIAALVAERIARWLAIARRARFLVTSRIALGGPDEHVVALGGLPVPEETTSEREAGMEALRSNPAVALFVNRAMRAERSFAPSPADVRAIADIVRHVDGVPLAIELAAARTTALTVAQIGERIATGLAVLGRRDDGGRHGSMARVLDDSYALLSPDLQRFYVAMAVFRGGFSLEAVEAIVAIESISAVDALTELVRHSLVRASVVDSSPSRRFLQIATIHEHALRRFVDDPERATLRARHASYYAHLAGELSARAEHGDRDAAGQLSLDTENMLEACAAASPHERIVLALSLEPSLARAGRLATVAQLLEVAAAHDDARSPVDTHLAIALARGRTRIELGDMTGAKAMLEAAHQRAASAASSGSPTVRASVLGKIGEIVEVRGETVAARALFSEALAILASAEPGHARDVTEADVRAASGHALRREGALEDALAELVRAMSLYRQLGREERLASTMYEAAVIALFRRDAQALAMFDEGLVLARSARAPIVEASLTTARGTLLQERGELEAALSHHVRAITLYRDAGHRYGEASTLYYLAGVYLERGEAGECLRLAAQGLASVRELEIPRYEALYEGLLAAALVSDPVYPDVAGALAAVGRAERAAAACVSERSLAATLTIHGLHVAAVAEPQTTMDRLTAARAAAAAHDNDDPRFALRVMAKRLDPPREASDLAAKATLSMVDGGRKVVASSPVGPACEIDLSRRAPLRNIVRRLAERRLEQPGQPVTVDDLVEVGWPGERLTHASAVNRVYVAVATLRKMGLRDILVSCDGGYTIEPTVIVTM